MPPLPLSALIRAILVWLVIILAESAQGALRRALFGPHVELIVRQLSVATGIVVIFAIAWLFQRWMGLRSQLGALAIGLVWAAMTVAFEFGLGRILGLGWPAIAADYDLARGGLMPLGLIAMALTPWAVGRLSRR